jgi:protein PhnA
MNDINQRSGGNCELCTSSIQTSVYELEDGDVESRGLLVCSLCQDGIDSTEPLDGGHWFCLESSIWSEYGAVQVMSYRLLERHKNTLWAKEILDQVYLDDDVMAWVQLGQSENEALVSPVDSNGTVLNDGDSVTLIRDLVVKGANFTAKRGTMVKNIRVGDDPSHIEGRVEKMSIMLKTEFLKKAN